MAPLRISFYPDFPAFRAACATAVLIVFGFLLTGGAMADAVPRVETGSNVDAGGLAFGGSKYAVLYAGKDDWMYCNGTTYYVFGNDLKFAFNTLVDDYGYSKDNIFVLYSNGSSYDFDGDGQNDVDYSATNSNLSAVFDILDSRMTDGDFIFFYATDHGYQNCAGGDCDYGLCAIDDDDAVSVTDLKSYFSKLDTETRSVCKMLLIATCYSGNMLEELKDLPADLTISTACAAYESAHYCSSCDCVCDNMSFNSCHHNAFSFYWIGAMHGSSPDGSLDFSSADVNGDYYVSAREAFDFARENDEFAAAKGENPQFFDSDCRAADYTSLGGIITNISGSFSFTNTCWKWFCMFVPFLDECQERIDTAGGGTLWLDSVPLPGSTVRVYARVCNPGGSEVVDAVVNFYVSDASLALIYPGDELTSIGSVVVPVIMPGDTVVVGPVQYEVPSNGNTFGEPYFTFIATAEHPLSPITTGWMKDDHHVTAHNTFELYAVPGEAKTIHFKANNPLEMPVKAVLHVNDELFPSSWSYSVVPGGQDSDTLWLAPHTYEVIEMNLAGYHTGDTLGTLLVRMEYLTENGGRCTSCDDSLCGGLMGDAGACVVNLNLEVTTGEEELVPRGFNLEQNYPNPFNPLTNISFSLPRSCHVELAVYDVSGKLVKTLVNGELKPGVKRYTWDGKNEYGRDVDSGVYFCRLKVCGRVFSRKIVLVR